MHKAPSSYSTEALQTCFAGQSSNKLSHDLQHSINGSELLSSSTHHGLKCKIQWASYTNEMKTDGHKSLEAASDREIPNHTNAMMPWMLMQSLQLRSITWQKKNGRSYVLKKGASTAKTRDTSHNIAQRNDKAGTSPPMDHIPSPIPWQQPDWLRSMMLCQSQ